MAETADFAANRRQAEDAGLLGGGDYLKHQEGANRLRLLTMCLAHPSTYKGERTFKWLCYVIDRRDGKVKPYFMPHKIYKAIEGLQQDPDYAFVSVPMPYDLNVNAENAGKMTVKYTVIPAKKETPVTAEELAQLAKMKPLRELHETLREKARKERERTDSQAGDTDFDSSALENELEEA